MILPELTSLSSLSPSITLFIFDAIETLPPNVKPINLNYVHLLALTSFPPPLPLPLCVTAPPPLVLVEETSYLNLKINCNFS